VAASNNILLDEALANILMTETNFTQKIPKDSGIKFKESERVDQNSVKAIITKTPNIYMISNEINNL
jgi:hypothetical protein